MKASEFLKEVSGLMALEDEHKLKSYHFHKMLGDIGSANFGTYDHYGSNSESPKQVSNQTTQQEEPSLDIPGSTSVDSETTQNAGDGFSDLLIGNSSASKERTNPTPPQVARPNKKDIGDYEEKAAREQLPQKIGNQQIGKDRLEQLRSKPAEEHDDLVDRRDRRELDHIRDLNLSIRRSQARDRKDMDEESYEEKDMTGGKPEVTSRLKRDYQTEARAHSKLVLGVPDNPPIPKAGLEALPGHERHEIYKRRQDPVDKTVNIRMPVNKLGPNDPTAKSLVDNTKSLGDSLFGPDSYHPHRKACSQASLFLAGLSREKTFGEAHRQAALFHHVVIHPMLEEEEVSNSLNQPNSNQQNNEI